MRWTVAIPKPGSMPPAAAGLDGNADSLEQAAHALVDTARAYLRRQQREPSPESVEGHLDGVRVTIEGLLDPAVAAHAVAEAIVASATAVVGPIAFVGFLAGPIARRLLPGRPAIGIGALVGAVVVVAADYAAAYAIPGTALPVGVVTGLLGAPVLLWMLRSRTTSPEGR